MKMILMKPTNNNNNRDKIPTAYLWSTHKISTLGLGYIQCSCWCKGFFWNPQTTQIAKTIVCSLQIESKNFFWRQHTQKKKTHSTWGGSVGIYIETSLLHSGVLCTGKYSAGFQKIKVKANWATEPLIYNLPCFKIWSSNGGTKLRRVISQQLFDMTVSSR